MNTLVVAAVLINTILVFILMSLNNLCTILCLKRTLTPIDRILKYLNNESSRCQICRIIENLTILFCFYGFSAIVAKQN